MSPTELPALQPQHTALAQPSTKDARLMEAARKLEATFLSEMLKHAGLGETRGEFGGGAGESQFSSLLRDAQADAIANQGGIGLAEALFESMKELHDEE